jgi:hypothetical protein
MRSPAEGLGSCCAGLGAAAAGGGACWQLSLTAARRGTMGAGGCNAGMCVPFITPRSD